MSEENWSHDEGQIGWPPEQTRNPLCSSNTHTGYATHAHTHTHTIKMDNFFFIYRINEPAGGRHQPVAALIK